MLFFRFIVNVLVVAKSVSFLYFAFQCISLGCFILSFAKMLARRIFSLGVFSSQHFQSCEERLLQIANKSEIGSPEDMLTKNKIGWCLVPRES